MDDAAGGADGGPAIGEITRELLMSGALIGVLSRSAPDIRILTDAERAASLRATLQARPDSSPDIWLFAYGSLMWNPTVMVAERRRVHVAGWRRAFCMLARAGRGTGSAPGLMLALREGGDCEGLALRVAPNDVETGLDLLWRREMIAGSYAPRWLPMLDDSGEMLAHGLAFTMDASHANFVGELSEGQTVERLATARGELGTCADYLFRTEAGLRANDIIDPTIERLAMLVRERLGQAVAQAAPP